MSAPNLQIKAADEAPVPDAPTEVPPAGPAEPAAPAASQEEPLRPELQAILESGASEDDMLNEILERKERLNLRANKHRALRDRLNEETRGHSQRRDGMNAEVRGLIDKANQHKSQRDQLNQSVREAKKLRDELNTLANERLDALNATKQDRLPRDGPSVSKLRMRLKQLEFEHMTKSLAPKKEKELIDVMSALQKEIQEKEKAFEQDQEVKGAYDAMREAKEKAETQHRLVTELADKAQAEHDSMVSLFEEADKVRKDADAAQTSFVGSKQDADKVHREYIDMVNTIRDYEKVFAGLRQKLRKDRRDKEMTGARAEADDIFAKFRSGEKLSTEDLMALQRAGLL